MRILDVLNVSLELIRALRPLVAGIRRYDPDLARQLKRAANSMVLNIGEGTSSYGRNDKVRFGTAAGSTHEAYVALLVAVAWGYLEDQAIEGLEDLFDRIMAMLWKLRH